MFSCSTSVIILPAEPDQSSSEITRTSSDKFPVFEGRIDCVAVAEIFLLVVFFPHEAHAITNEKTKRAVRSIIIRF